MPRVTPPKTWKDRHKKALTLLIVLIVIGIVSSIFGLVAPRKALAAGAQIPTPAGQPGTFGGPGNSDEESLAVTESTSPKTLIESPVTWVKLYFSPADGANGTLQIYNMPFECDQYAAGGDWSLVEHGGSCPFPGIPDDTNDQVLYDFYNTNATEQPTTPIFTIDGQTGKDFNNPAITRATNVASGTWTGNINVPLGGTVESGITDYNVVLMRVRWGNCPSGIAADCQNPLVPPPAAFGTTRLHAFLVQTTQAQDNIGYWAQNGATGTGTYPTFGSFTTHYAGTGTDFDIQNVEVDFAPPCTVTSPQTATIRWKNGDSSDVTNNPGHDGNANTAYPTANPWKPSGNDIANSFQLFSVSPTGVRSLVETMPGGSSAFGQQNLPGNPIAATGTNAAGAAFPVNNIGGFQDYREVNFTAEPGYKYQWVWHNVDAYFEGSAGQDPPTNAHNIQMWIPYDSINYALNCGFNYHSTINATGTTPAGGTVAAPTTLNFSNPANLNLTFQAKMTNTGAAAGPPATVVPRLSVGSAVWSGGPTTSWVDTSPVPSTVPGGIPIGATLTAGTISYSLNPNTPDGTILCFGDHISPNAVVGDAGIDNDPPDQCYKVQNARRFPSVVGSAGDIHAGGGLCGQAVAPGIPYITGNASATGTDSDYGDYVVSSSGLISNFSSNDVGGTSATPNALTLGATGTYANICRPDLYDNAQANPSGVTVAPGAYHIGTDANFAGNVVFVNGNVTIDTTGGSLNHKLTIVATGDVTIDNNIAVGGAAGPRSSVASLGIIAHGNILIDPAATTVDAYLFSDNTINTCYTGASEPVPPQCDTTLTVNGFFMADALSLRRLGPLGTTSTSGTTTGEDVILNPEVYLNPPAYFDDSVDNVSLQGQGERQPLF